MTGVILCGGESTRMDSDKGLLRYNSNTWAQIAANKIKDLRIPVVISINKKQQEAYSLIFSPKALVVDEDPLQVRGPLYGLLSVHLKYPNEDLLILACDMPLIEADLLKDLLKHYHQQKNFDAFVYKNDEAFEPLCGVYKANGLSKILGFYQTSRLAKHSMKYILEQMNTYAIPLSEGKKHCFRNFNTQEELHGL